MKILWPLLLAAVLFFGCSKNTSPGNNNPGAEDTLHVVKTKFVIPVFPDTQETMVNRQAMFFSQVRWIASAQDSLNNRWYCTWATL